MSQVRPREAVLKALPKRRNVHEVLVGADAGPHRLDALDKVGVVESTTWLEKLQHFEQQLMHRRIGCGELKQAFGEREGLLEILGTLPGCSGIGEIGGCG